MIFVPNYGCGNIASIARMVSKFGGDAAVSSNIPFIKHLAVADADVHQHVGGAVVMKVVNLPMRPFLAKTGQGSVVVAPQSVRHLCTEGAHTV